MSKEKLVEEKVDYDILKKYSQILETEGPELLSEMNIRNTLEVLERVLFEGKAQSDMMLRELLDVLIKEAEQYDKERDDAYKIMSDAEKRDIIADETRELTQAASEEFYGLKRIALNFNKAITILTGLERDKKIEVGHTVQELVDMFKSELVEIDAKVEEKEKLSKQK